ncbi:hypothetical protein ACFY1S_08755 [Micromonospora sp. NPDC000663]|uniref:hypothetical protein n=1 Tax=Micromonospora sp. NPDC000663 TaxID=3364218 RepID=UPI003686C11A
MEAVSVIKVAKSGGKHVLTLTNGKEARLSAQAYAQWSKTEYGAQALARIASGDVSTNGWATGDCGMQGVWGDGVGSRILKVQLAFNLIHDILYSETWVDVYDDGGRSQRYYSTGLADGAWGTTEYLGAMTPGPSTVEVNGESYAVLVTGTICYSLGAYGHGWIY